MSPPIATIVCLGGIAGLFWLDRDRTVHTSKSLWIAVIWLLICGSRPVSMWFQTGPVTFAADQHNVEANPINLIIFSILLAAALITLFHRASRVEKLLKLNWPILLFFLYCAASCMWSDFPLAALRKWIRSTGDLLMILIVLTEPDPTAAFRRLLSRTGFVLLPLSVLLIKYYPEQGRMYSNDWLLMYNGVTDHKNTLGLICLVFGLGFIWRFLEHYRLKGDPNRRRRLIACGLILGTVMWLLRMANSATSHSCLMLAAVVLVFTNISVRPNRPTVHVLFALLVIIPPFAVFADSGGGLIEALGRNSTLTGRTAVWQQVTAMSGNPVVGVGFESFWLGDRLKEFWDEISGSQITEAHNGYLEVYLNLGWCGVILLAVVLVAGYRNAFVAFRWNHRIGGLKLAYVLASLVYSLTEAGFRMLSPMWLFFLLFGTAVPISSLRNIRNAENIAPNRLAHTYDGAA